MAISQQLPTLSSWLSKAYVWAAKQSVFSIAAWYGLLTPFVAAGIALLFFRLEGPYDYHDPLPFPNQRDVVDIAFNVLLSSFMAAIVGLFGLRRHGVKTILWKSAVGMLASCFFGFFCVLNFALRASHQ